MTNFVSKLLQVSTLSAACFGAMSAFASESEAAWFACRPTDVTEIGTRIHVRCSNSIALNGNTVVYVAIKNDNDLRAQRWITMAQAALLSGKIFWADVPAASTTNTAGCAASDCRTPTSFGVGLKE